MRLETESPFRGGTSELRVLAMLVFQGIASLGVCLSSFLLKIAQRFNAGSHEIGDQEPLQGRHERSIKHTLIELQTVFSQHRLKLFAKRPRAMMFQLAPDVRGRRLNAGDADAKGSISFLPSGKAASWKRLAKPT